MENACLAQGAIYTYVSFEPHPPLQLYGKSFKITKSYTIIRVIIIRVIPSNHANVSPYQAVMQ